MGPRRITGGRACCVAAVGAALAAVACTANPPSVAADKDDAATSSDDAGVTVTDDGAATCQHGTYTVDTFAPNLQKTGYPASGDPSDAGASGALTFILESNEIGDAAAPPAEPYMNAFTLKLMDSSGQPIKDATVTLPANNQALGWSFARNPWMPLMNHGSSILSPPVTNNEDGTYGISVYLSMAGLWAIYIVAQTTDGITDSAEYTFCLP
jgi:hypothetical protein